MRPFILLAVLLAAGFGAWLWYNQRDPDSNRSAEYVETAVVAIRPVIRETVRVTGEVAPALSTEVKSEISGAIDRLYVQNGMEVTNRQVLIQLDRSELESQQSELQRVIESAELRAEQAQRDFARQEDLFKKGFVTQKSFDDASTEKKLADNMLEIELARLRTLQEKLAKTTLRAPHRGQVLEANLSEGQVIVGANSVSQGMVLMKIADLNRLVIKTDINEVDVTRLEVGMPAEVRFDSIPQLSLTGTVEQISPSAVKKEEVRVFPVDVTVKTDDARIRPGISAIVILTLAEVKSVPAVNVSAVFASDEEHYVFLKDDGGFVRRTVEIGINDAEVVEIRAGLQPGDEIALTRPLPSLEKDLSF